MLYEADIANLLGIEGPAPLSGMRLALAIEQGLPVAALDRLSSLVAPDDGGFRHRIVPKPALDRRRGERLTARESDLLARVAHLWAMARKVWGSDEAARAFLFRRHPLLEMRAPMDVAMGTGLGARCVEDLLGRLQHGSAS